MAIDLKALKPHKISRDLSGYMTYIYGPAGAGKAIVADTIIPTPSGDKKIDTVKIGDYVFDRHGRPTRVLGVYPQGKLNVYKVTFRDGRVAYCNDEHLWTSYYGDKGIVTFTLQEMIEMGITDFKLLETFKDAATDFVSAEYTGEQKEMICLYVDNPEHLFLINDYIVTHNTTLGSQFPKPLLLAFERGYNAIPGIVAQDVASWSEMKQVLRQLDDPEIKETFKTIVIDTVDRASAACEKYICNQIGVENIGDGGWQNNGWSKVKKEWEQTFTSLAMKGYAILFISHSKTKKITRKDGSEYDAIIPTCPSAYNEIIKNMVDMEGFISIDNAQRSLVLRTIDDTIECKSRFKYIEASIPFSYNSLVEAMNQAIDKEAEIHGNDFITEERETLREETTYDYDTLMDEFKRITTPLLKEDAAKYGPHLTAIIEKYLGKGKKVSETTPAQADFIFLINDEIKREVLKK